MTIATKIAKFVAYRRTVRELNALDSRQLRDVGLTRGDIENVARANAL